MRPSTTLAGCWRVAFTAPYVNPSDLNDIKRANGKNVFKPMEDYQWVNSYGLKREAARAYLAAISEADLSLGILLDQLEKSKFADNTIVVIMGDHGCRRFPEDCQ